MRALIIRGFHACSGLDFCGGAQGRGGATKLTLRMLASCDGDPNPEP